MSRIFEVFWVFLRLGLTSFGGPVAHLAFFHDAFVKKLKWLDEQTYSETLALCQFLPGPASSQLGFAIGYMRAGIPGAFAAWIAFTLPSAAVMIGFGLGLLRFAPEGNAPWLQGLKIAVVIVVAKAIWGMAQGLCPDRSRMTLAIVCAAAMLLLGTVWAQVAVIVLGGIIGLILFRKMDGGPSEEVAGAGLETRHQRASIVWLIVFFVLLFGLPFAAQYTERGDLAFFSGYYQAGSLVFGGGHVVLPLLRDFVVPNGWMTDDTFMAGYGAAQAMPGPLFTISAFLGTVSVEGPLSGVTGGIVALVAIFVPSWLLVLGALPIWQRLRGNAHFAAALRGANAAVVGILIAAFYQPVWRSGIQEPRHFVIGLILFGLVIFWKLPPWGAVLLAAGLGMLML